MVQLMEKATKERPAMWGSLMIKFGNKRFKSPASGRGVDWFKMGFCTTESEYFSIPEPEPAATC